MLQQSLSFGLQRERVEASLHNSWYLFHTFTSFYRKKSIKIFYIIPKFWLCSFYFNINFHNNTISDFYILVM